MRQGSCSLSGFFDGKNIAKERQAGGIVWGCKIIYP